jgi:hypothetical protein
MEKVDTCLYIFYGLLEHLTAICYILWPFGSFSGHLEYFYAFWYVVPRNIW